MQFVVCTLCALFLFSTSVFCQTSKSADVLKRLIDLPAPVAGEPVGPVSEPDVRERPDEFYRWKNVPPDDAPLADLLEFWKGQRYAPSTILFRKMMSAKTAERLLDHFKENPGLIYDYLGAIPPNDKTAAAIRDIHKMFASRPEQVYPGNQLKEWLTHNTPEGVSELTKRVRKIRDQNDYVSNEFQVSLKALAKLDWDAARPHVERLEFDASNPHSQILAYWVRYLHAINTNSLSDIDTYRQKLQKVVEDRSARWSQRDLAMDGLVDGGDWDGRDEWYMSLFADETLLEIQENGYTGMTTILNAAESTEEWIKRFLKAVKSDNKAVRSAAARNLASLYTNQQEIIEALLPWVTDPNWAKQARDGERSKIIEALGTHDIPGAVPALISVLTRDESEYWLAAATALGKKKDLRAAPALRNLLPNVSGPLRQAIIVALVASGAMSPDEQMANVEAYATMAVTEQGRTAIERETADDEDYDGEEEEEAAPKKKSTVPLEVIIGKVLADAEEPEEGLAVRVIEREKTLRKKQPEVAAKLAEIISGWRGRPVFLEMLRKLRSGEGDLDTILGLLSERAEIRTKIPNDVASLRASSGMTRGIGACLAGAEDEFLSILGTGDPESQVAMLGCARLIRTPLPVAEVGGLMQNKNELLQLAAERYLESEDSVQARKMILARHPGEAKILGSYSAFVPNPSNIEAKFLLRALFQTVNAQSYPAAMPHMTKFEARLQTELMEDKNLVSIFGRLPEAVSGQQVIRVYKNRVTYTYYEDSARYWTRDLTEKEYKDFYAAILSNKIDELPAVLQLCHHGCPSSEFVMLSRDGGRRNFLSGFQPKDGLAALDAHFEAFKESNLKLNYRLAEKIRGLEVIVADNKFPVHAVWKKDSELRFLVSDLALLESTETDLAEKMREENEIEIDDENEEEAQKRLAERYVTQEKRRHEAMGKELSWRTIENGKIGRIVAQPADINVLPALASMPLSIRNNFFRGLLPTRASEGILASRYDGGLFKWDGSSEPVRLKSGNYGSAILPPDKKWVVVTKYPDEGEPFLVRVNLQSLQEIPVNIPPSPGIYSVGYLPTHNRVLVYRGPEKKKRSLEALEMYGETEVDEEAEPETPDPKAASTTSMAVEHFLLDPATGAVRSVKGEFRPLEENLYRPLQPSTTTGAVWAAVYDAPSKTTQIGLYVEKTFSFIPVATYPEIELRSTDIWVSEKENKVYFVYQGHLLAAPLRQA